MRVEFASFWWQNLFGPDSRELYDPVGSQDEAHHVEVIPSEWARREPPGPLEYRLRRHYSEVSFVVIYSFAGGIA